LTPSRLSGENRAVPAAALIRHASEITGPWLEQALGREGLELLGSEPIGTGQMSQSHRVRFHDGSGGQDSVVVKLASEDPASRSTGVGMGAYYREIAFYRELAPQIDGPLARCHLASYDDEEGWFTLVLEDVVDGVQGDQIAGCDAERARIALGALARLQAPVIGRDTVGAAAYLNQPNPLDQTLLTQLLPAFLARYGERVAPEHAELAGRLVGVLDAWSAERRPPLGLVHGDYRLDNLLFGAGGATVVDWQTVGWGPALLDASYFIGGCLPTEERRRSERELLRGYHEELLSQGVRGLGWEQCWEEYRRQCFAGLVMTIAASMVVQRTERGDEMFMTWFERNATQALDLDAAELLPERGSGTPAPLRPAPEDEGTHEPGSEALWNESWYFDAVGDDGQLGVYVRLGRLPNQGLALYTACVCGPGRPTAMLVDAAAPLPDAEDERQSIETPALDASQRCERPLERFSVRVRGTAEAYEDQSGPLRGERGEPLEISLQLVWETDGEPYAWRSSTRYEIPCRVSGTVTVGEETIAFSGPGQRDHSWGSRDWWAVDWMWSALHLDDGTHTHAVGLPELPGYGVGYVQRDGEVVEIETVRAEHELGPGGLIAAATIASAPPELEVQVDPVAFGPLRLQAPDGRLSLFPRAMCRVRTGDGRTGTGWVEWNRVQR
jgi:hypothetical protein